MIELLIGAGLILIITAVVVVFLDRMNYGSVWLKVHASKWFGIEMKLERPQRKKRTKT